MKDKSDYTPALRFNWLTPFYDAIVGTTSRERTFKTALIEHALIQDRENVLDLACGTGTLAIWIKQKHPGCGVYAIDGDPMILSRARKKAECAGTEINISHGYSQELPYEDGKFSCVLTSLFFHHLNWQDKETTAKEIFRVLKPGGRLLVADWGKPTNKLMRIFFLSIQILDGFKNTNPHVEGKIPKLFSNVGFAQSAKIGHFSTIYGTLALFHAFKPR